MNSVERSGRSGKLDDVERERERERTCDRWGVSEQKMNSGDGD